MNPQVFLQEIQSAFEQGERYTLTEVEVEFLYLLLIRMSDLEEMGRARDWDGIEAYCPTE